MSDLDNARAAEAARLWGEREGAEHADCGGIAALAARLAREGWEPAEDELMKEAFDICYANRLDTRMGSVGMSAVLAALKRGIELAKERG